MPTWCLATISRMKATTWRKMQCIASSEHLHIHKHAQTTLIYIHIQYTIYNVQCTIYNIHIHIHIQYTTYNMQYAIYNIQYIHIQYTYRHTYMWARSPIPTPHPLPPMVWSPRLHCPKPSYLQHLGSTASHLYAILQHMEDSLPFVCYLEHLRATTSSLDPV